MCSGNFGLSAGRIKAQAGGRAAAGVLGAFVGKVRREQARLQEQRRNSAGQTTASWQRLSAFVAVVRALRERASQGQTGSVVGTSLRSAIRGGSRWQDGEGQREGARRGARD